MTSLALRDPEIQADGLTSARLRIRRWVRDELTAVLAAARDVQLPEVADSARDHFLADAAFLAGPIGDLIRAVAYEEAGAYCQETRSGLVRFGEKAVPRGTARDEAATRLRRNPFQTWLEHAGDRTVRLMDMTREQLTVAAAERTSRGTTELVIAATWGELVKKLAPGEQVKQRFTVEEVRAIYDAQRQKRAA